MTIILGGTEMLFGNPLFFAFDCILPGSATLKSVEDNSPLRVRVLFSHHRYWTANLFGSSTCLPSCIFSEMKHRHSGGGAWENGNGSVGKLLSGIWCRAPTPMIFGTGGPVSLTAPNFNTRLSSVSAVDYPLNQGKVYTYTITSSANIPLIRL